MRLAAGRLINPKLLLKEVLAGLVVALALIPEAISFAVIAGVDPKYGLFSSFILACTTAIVGGRPALISAATGAVALVIAPVSRTYGIEFFLATIVLAGIFQILLAAAGVAKLMRFIPRSVMVGFVNSLAIFVFMAQIPQLIGVPWLVYPLVALGIVIVLLFPKITTVVPAPLVAIIVVSAVTVFFHLQVPTVGDQGELPQSLPVFHLPHLPLAWSTLQTIAPYSLAMAVVGLMESLMTAKLVDDLTDTHSDKTREGMGQGIANIISGLFGGMGGCAVIGQTMMNVKGLGARTRLSTFLAGLFLLILVVVLGDLVQTIPMAALVAVMIMVSIAAFDWHSVKPATLRKMPLSENLVMFSTVVIVVVTHNLAIGVIAGVFIASVMFVRRVAHLVTVTREVKTTAGVEVAHYTVSGQLLFASSNDLTTLFAYGQDPDQIVIDLSASTVWDASSVAALDAIETKYAQKGKQVTFTGMDDYSAAFHGRMQGALS